MFHGLLKKLGKAVIGGAIFSTPKNQRLFFKVKQSLQIDGWIAVPLLVGHWLCHQKRCLLNVPPNYRTVEAVFRSHGIPIDRYHRPNDVACIDRIKRLNIDVVLNNQPWILHQGVLAAPQWGCLNRHTSMLPEYRGIEPVFHALLNGDSEVGVSIHRMTEEIDAGEVYAQIVIKAGRSVYDCYKRAFAVGADLYFEAITNLGKNKPLLLANTVGTKYYKDPTREEIELFRKKGLRYL